MGHSIQDMPRVLTWGIYWMIIATVKYSFPLKTFDLVQLFYQMLFSEFPILRFLLWYGSRALVYWIIRCSFLFTSDENSLQVELEVSGLFFSEMIGGKWENILHLQMVINMVEKEVLKEKVVSPHVLWVLCTGGERMMRPGYQQGISRMERSLALITDSLVRAVTVPG